LGKVTEVVSTKEAGAGNDVYLTIDKELHALTYQLLEEKLAGILLSKLRNIMNYDPSSEEDASDIIIPIDDAYYAFIANEILDDGHFDDADAGPVEKEVYQIFEARKESALNEIISEMNNSQAPAYKELGSEMQAYIDYVVDDILKTQTGILMSDAIDTSDTVYKQWVKEETINLYQYLNYAISKSWIDTSKLTDYVSEEKYSDASEIYQGILSYLRNFLVSDINFDKLLYKYLIKSTGISGAQICAMVYEQGVLPMEEEVYQNLVAGTQDAYQWLYYKIQNLEITPGQLGLEPCTASAVVSDPDTGEVLVCVSYPGYDNNRLANTMDSKYYSQLVTGLSRPFYNNATQERTAPGSTYKMLSAIAGLTEGVITGGTCLDCIGVFDKVTPSPRCWVYPSNHYSLSVIGALEVSCNNFFYEVGYRLGLDQDDDYQSEIGIATLTKYAEMFGLNQTSGLEIPESDPEISDEYAVQSAIGQGTNNYTVSQLNRYVAAIANKGTVYNLSLLSKTTDVNGKIIKNYEPSVVNQITQVSDQTWNLIHAGMVSMIENHTSFSNLGLTMAGKTGTAQQSDIHPDHGLFVGFAPAEEPEIAIAVRIANGYSSTYAAEIGRDIAKAYFNVTPKEELIQGKAAELGTVTVGD
jgi:penicillin-binding protein 2